MYLDVQLAADGAAERLLQKATCSQRLLAAERRSGVSSPWLSMTDARGVGAANPMMRIRYEIRCPRRFHQSASRAYARCRSRCAAPAGTLVARPADSSERQGSPR